MGCVALCSASDLNSCCVAGQLGTALAFLNVFRSNLSYGRYWEGRGQLGVMVKSGRELIRKVVAYTRVPEDPKEDQVRQRCQLACATRISLAR